MAKASSRPSKTTALKKTDVIKNAIKNVNKNVNKTISNKIAQKKSEAKENYKMSREVRPSRNDLSSTATANRNLSNSYYKKYKENMESISKLEWLSKGISKLEWLSKSLWNVAFNKWKNKTTLSNKKPSVPSKAKVSDKNTGMLRKPATPKQELSKSLGAVASMKWLKKADWQWTYDKAVENYRKKVQKRWTASAKQQLWGSMWQNELYWAKKWAQEAEKKVKQLEKYNKRTSIQKKK